MNEPASDNDRDLQLEFQRAEVDEVSVDVDALIQSAGNRSDVVRLVCSIGLVGAAASVALLAVLSSFGSGGQAFAQVKDRVEQLRTVEFIEVLDHVLDSKWPASDDHGQFGPGVDPLDFFHKRLSTLEAELQKASGEEAADLEQELALVRPLAEKAKAGLALPDIWRIRIKGKKQRRRDSIFPYGGSMVADAEAGESVSFDHDAKVKRSMNTQILYDGKTGARTKQPITFDPAVDFFQEFRAVPDDAQVVGRQLMDGKQVVGYRTTSNKKRGRFTQTYWIDESMNLPVKIVSEFQSSQQGAALMRGTKHSFVFDETMDDAIFSTATPPGYTEKKGGWISAIVSEDEDSEQKGND